MQDTEDVVSSSLRIAFFDMFAAFLAALVIVPAMGAAGVKDFTGRPGLLFIYLPKLFQTMPLGTVISGFFFLAGLFAGFTSLLNLFETPIACLREEFHRGRFRSSLLVLLGGGALSFFIQGSVGPWMDLLSIYLCPLGAALAAIFFAWVWGKEAVVSQLGEGRSSRLAGFYGYYKYVFVTGNLLIWILGILLGGIG